MRKDGVWWVAQRRRSSWVYTVASGFALALFASASWPVVRDGGAGGPDRSTYGAPFHYRAWTSELRCLDGSDSRRTRGPDEATVIDAVNDYKVAVRACLGDSCGLTAGEDRRLSYPHVAAIVTTENGCTLDDESIDGTVSTNRSGRPSTAPIDRTSIFVLAAALVFTGLADMTSRWITRRTGRESTSLNGWVTWTTGVGVVGTTAISYLLFPHQLTSILALSGFCAGGVWHLIGQAFFGARDIAQSDEVDT